MFKNLKFKFLSFMFPLGGLLGLIISFLNGAPIDFLLRLYLYIGLFVILYNYLFYKAFFQLLKNIYNKYYIFNRINKIKFIPNIILILLIISIINIIVNEPSDINIIICDVLIFIYQCSLSYLIWMIVGNQISFFKNENN